MNACFNVTRGRFDEDDRGDGVSETALVLRNDGWGNEIYIP